MCLGKVPEPVHQPFRSEVGRGADRENAAILPLQEPLGADCNPVQRVADDVR